MQSIFDNFLNNLKMNTVFLLNHESDFTFEYVLRLKLFYDGGPRWPVTYAGVSSIENISGGRRKNK